MGKSGTRRKTGAEPVRAGDRGRERLQQKGAGRCGEGRICDKAFQQLYGSGGLDPVAVLSAEVTI